MVSIIPIALALIWLSGCNLGSMDTPINTSSDAGNTMTSSVDEQIIQLEKNRIDDPKNITNYISLSTLYLQRIRETADISDYETIARLMREAEKIDPKNSDILSLQSQIDLGRHNFWSGQVLIQRAIESNPNRAAYYGILGDTQIELGEYTGAVDSFQKMIDMRPDYNSYIRIGYIRELYGDIPGAISSLQLAIDAGSKHPENIAFAYVELWKLELRENLENSKQYFESAIRLVPEYPPALEWLGKVAYYNQDLTLARSYFERAYERLPIVQYLINLADLDIVMGRVVEAKQKITLAEITFDTTQKSGINTDLEESLFLSDHDLRLPDALMMAERAYQIRPSIFAADSLSWALYKNKQYSEAAKYTPWALILGEHDPTILYHQGMFALANGNTADAKKYLDRALVLHPRFAILWVEQVRDALNSIK